MARTVRQWLQDGAAVVAIIAVLASFVGGYAAGQVQTNRLAWSDAEQVRRIEAAERRVDRVEDTLARLSDTIGRIDERTRLLAARLGIPESAGGGINR